MDNYFHSTYHIRQARYSCYKRCHLINCFIPPPARRPRRDSHRGRRLDVAAQEHSSALEACSREAAKAATAARERMSRVEAEHTLALRENGKASVRQRALERELARIKDGYVLRHRERSSFLCTLEQRISLSF